MTADEPADPFASQQAHHTSIQDIAHLEQSPQSKRQLTQAVMDSLAAHVAVLDPEGVIIATNAAWKRFARENSPGEEPRNTGIGVNYLGICHGACGEASDGAIEVEEGIRGVLGGSVGGPLRMPPATHRTSNAGSSCRSPGLRAAPMAPSCSTSTLPNAN